MTYTAPSRPNQPVKQRPSQDVTRQTTKEPPKPELVPGAKVATRVQGREPGLERRRGDAQHVEKDGGQDGEDKIEEEAAVGLEAEDACGGAEYRAQKGLEICEGLFLLERGMLAMLFRCS